MVIEWHLNECLTLFSTDGVFKVFTASNLYAPLLYFVDSAPLKVKYVHFASLSRMQFYYDVDETAIIANKNKIQLTAIDVTPVMNSLIVPLTIPVGGEDICKFICHSIIVSQSGVDIPINSSIFNFHFFFL